MHQTLEKFHHFYEHLDIDQLDEIKQLYSRDVQFIDPAHQINGHDALQRYFEQLFQKVSHCRFSIHQITEQNGQAFVTWTMDFAHPRLKGGDSVLVEGVSHLKFAEQIYYHRDYFDLGAMLYEHIPAFGAITRTIKNRLGQ